MTNETDNTLDGLLVRLNVVIGALREAHGLSREEVNEKVQEILDWNDDEDEGYPTEPDDSMDGDFDSGMASAGMGTDEDYGYYGGNEE